MIGPQDLLKITVFDEPDLTNSYRVDGDGFITFPYIGRVAAGGLTLAELQDRVRTLLAAGFIRNPQVRVEIGEFKSQSVLVSGEVRQPGKITMTGAMTLLEALAAAGSTTSSASSELTVAHPRKPGETGTPRSSRINWKDLQLGKGTDVGLQDGDIINVPKAQTFFITGQMRNGGPYRARARHDHAAGDCDGRRPQRARLRSRHHRHAPRERQEHRRQSDARRQSAAERHDHDPQPILLMSGLSLDVWFRRRRAA